MFETAVANASPLIYLGRTDNLHLLQNCAQKIFVPEAVVHEIRSGLDEPAAQAIDTCAWLKVVSVDTVPPEIVVWNLGAGESAVLACTSANANARAVITTGKAVVAPRNSEFELSVRSGSCSRQSGVAWCPPLGQ